MGYREETLKSLSSLKTYNANSDKTKINQVQKKIILYRSCLLYQLDTSTTDEMYSGQPFAILQCFLNMTEFFSNMTSYVMTKHGDDHHEYDNI